MLNDRKHVIVKKKEPKEFMTKFDKEVMTKEKVVKEHIKDKLTDAVRRSVENVNPLEAWKRQTEADIADENYPHTGAGKGLDWEGREKDVEAKPDDYDEKIQNPPIKEPEPPIEVVSGMLRSKGQN